MYNLNCNKVFYTFCPRRGGQHGILSWLCHHLNENILWLNNVKHPSVYSDDFVELFEKCKRTQGSLNPPQNNYSGYVNINNVKELQDIPNLSVIMSYEDFHTTNPQNIMYKELTSLKTYVIYMMRDAYNCMASRLKTQNLCSYQEQLRFISLIKDFYKYYLSDKYRERQYEDLHILYNKWAIDKEYREQIIHWFHLNFTDARFNNFINKTRGYEYGNNKDCHIEVLERWKSIRNHPSIKLIQHDKELVDMCHKIFDFKISNS